MKYFSMFSGIGGFELGIQNAIYNLRPNELADSQRPKKLHSTSDELLKWECVGYSEIDKYADQIYQKHFGGRNYGDATQINARELPDFELLVGGFPCQAFSIAGKRAGFDDTRGTLFFDIARILKEKRPRHLVLENVKGLLSHDTGKTFQTILGVLADLGYFVEWQVLNSKDFGVPQNRERVFIVGHLGGQPRRKVFPIFGDNRKDITVHEGTSQVSPTIGANYSKNQSDAPYIKVVGTLETDGWEKRHEQIRRVHSVEGLSPTIPTGTGGGVMTKIEVKPRIRRLTPLECERLQGFPDNWTALGVGDEPISDTQRYKMCGNAVTVNVVEVVISNLRKV